VAVSQVWTHLYTRVLQDSNAWLIDVTTNEQRPDPHNNAFRAWKM